MLQTLVDLKRGMDLYHNALFDSKYNGSEVIGISTFDNSPTMPESSRDMEIFRGVFSPIDRNSQTAALDIEKTDHAAYRLQHDEGEFRVVSYDKPRKNIIKKNGLWLTYKALKDNEWRSFVRNIDELIHAAS